MSAVWIRTRRELQSWCYSTNKPPFGQCLRERWGVGPICFKAKKAESERQGGK